MIYNEITDAIETAIGSVITIDQKDNEHFEPQMLTPWNRVTFLPVETENLTRGNNPLVRLNGLVQIDVVVAAGSGKTASGETVSQLTDYFYNNRMIPTTSYDDVRIINTWRGVSIQDGDWYITPVTLRWEQHYLT